VRLPDDDQKFNEEIKMRSERKAPIPGTVNSAKLALFMRPGGASKEDLKALNKLFRTTQYGIEAQIEWMLERYSIIKEDLGNGRYLIKWA
jgi:hypothetical protein